MPYLAPRGTVFLRSLNQKTDVKDEVHIVHHVLVLIYQTDYVVAVQLTKGASGPWRQRPSVLIRLLAYGSVGPPINDLAVKDRERGAYRRTPATFLVPQGFVVEKASTEEGADPLK